MTILDALTKLNKQITDINSVLKNADKMNIPSFEVNRLKNKEKELIKIRAGIEQFATKNT